MDTPETPKKRITITSSLKEISEDFNREKGADEGGCVTPLDLTLSTLQRDSGHIFKDDVNGFPTYSDIFFITPVNLNDYSFHSPFTKLHTRGPIHSP
jgi:hypothetical protein